MKIYRIYLLTVVFLFCNAYKVLRKRKKLIITLLLLENFSFKSSSSPLYIIYKIVSLRIDHSLMQSSILYRLATDHYLNV